MTQDHGLGERVYLEVKERALTGALPPHVKIDFAALADELDVSTTPVREAAMRLLGEGLLEPHPRGGARPVHVTEHRMRGLLDLHARLAVLAVEWTQGVAVAIAHDPADYEEATRRFFRALVQGTSNMDFIALFDGVGDRLASFRHQEPRVIVGAMEELYGLEAATRDPVRLRRALRTYHRRRISIVPQVVWLLNSDPRPAVI